MRVLVAGRNAKVLAQVAGAFASDLTIETATTKAASLALLERAEFDVIIACEKLGDGSGLEVLSHVAVNTPNTLRIFAARPSTLDVLKGELGLFGLFRTLTYPINFRKVWAALNLARSCRGNGELQGPTPQQKTSPALAPRPVAPHIRHVVLDSAWDEPQVERQRPPSGGGIAARSGTGTRTGTYAPAGAGAARTTWTNTAAMLAATEPAADAPSRAATAGMTATPARTATASMTRAMTGATAKVAATAMTTATAIADARATKVAEARATVARSRTTAPGAAANGRATPGPRSTANSRGAATSGAVANARATPNARPAGNSRGAASSGPAANARATANARSTAGAQAGARATAGGQAVAHPRPIAKVDAGPARRAAPNTGAAVNTQGVKVPQTTARIPESDAFKRALARRNGANRRQEPSVTNESLAQLAQLSVTRRPTNYSLGVPGGRKRTAFFVGSGVFAAGAAAVLTFFMLNTNHSMGRSSLPMVASISSTDRTIPQKVFPWQPVPAQPTPTTFVQNDAVASAAAADMEVEAEAASEQPGIEPGHPGPPPPNPPPGPSEPPSYDASGNLIEE